MLHRWNEYNGGQFALQVDLLRVLGGISVCQMVHSCHSRSKADLMNLRRP